MSLHVHWFFLRICWTISFCILTSMKTKCTIETTRKHNTYKITSKPRANYKHIGNHRNTLETINTKNNIQYGNDTHIYKYIIHTYVYNNIWINYSQSFHVWHSLPPRTPRTPNWTQPIRDACANNSPGIWPGFVNFRVVPKAWKGLESGWLHSSKVT